MVKSDFISLTKNPKKVNQSETILLKSMIDKFPYFQSARALYLKGLKNQDSFRYNNELKLTAAYTTDRIVLFDYISSKDFNTQKEDTHQLIDEKITTETPSSNQEVIVESPNLTKETSNSNKEQIKEDLTKDLEIGKPLTFSTNESFSFNQWLELSVKKPINRTSEKETQKPTTKASLIDRFIKNNPKIEPVSKDKPITIHIPEDKSDSSLMTETLAKVYLEQKKYDNAIQAYRILSLKYPEKSGFFADQIKRIQILQKK